MKDMFSDNFLQEFTAALKERNRAVSLGKGVVGFGRFWDNNDKGVGPQMMAEGYSSIEKGDEAIWLRCKSPFDQLVADSAKSQC